MKKILVSLLGLILIISMFGCSNKQEITEYNLDTVREQTYEEYLSEQTEETLMSIEGIQIVDITISNIEEQKYSADVSITASEDISDEAIEQIKEYLNNTFENVTLTINGKEISYVEIENNNECAEEEMPRLIRVKNELYYDCAEESTETGRCGMMDGTIEKTVDNESVPMINNMSNFGVGYGYQYGFGENKIEVLIDDKWCIFRKYEAGTFEIVDEKIQNIYINFDESEENKAYGKILWDAFYLAEMEGEQYGDPKSEGHDEACFTIYDVDADGKNELIIEWPGDCMATYVSYIWDYEDGKTHVEIVEFPMFTYYDNGIIEVEWSHNQGLAGDFWPYTVYKYNKETDSYDCIGGVDAWDGNCWETGIGGASFPTDIDEDGDGIVYYIFSGDRVGYYDIEPADGINFINWRNEYLDGANEVKLPFVQLNEENIEKLGASKPNYQFDDAEG